MAIPSLCYIISQGRCHLFVRYGHGRTCFLAQQYISVLSNLPTKLLIEIRKPEITAHCSPPPIHPPLKLNPSMMHRYRRKRVGNLQRRSFKAWTRNATQLPLLKPLRICLPRVSYQFPYSQCHKKFSKLSDSESESRLLHLPVFGKLLGLVLVFTWHECHIRKVFSNTKVSKSLFVCNQGLHEGI